MHVHETNLTPSGERQGCHGAVTIQRRVKEAAMIPSHCTSNSMSEFPCILSISFKVDMTRMLFPPYPPSQKYIVGFKANIHIPAIGRM